MNEVRRWAFDPYEDARPIGRCPNCGEPIYEGDDYYYVTTAGQDVLVGCENCAGRRTARVAV